MTASAAPELGGLDAVILCGGLGTRLRDAVPGVAKGLAPIGGRPFMDILIDDLMQQGLRRFVLCVGHLKEGFFEHFGARQDAEFVFSTEEQPLGTGGAVQNALPKIESNPCFVLNGDSIVRVDLASVARRHGETGAAASFVLSPKAGRDDGGTVCLDGQGRVLSFLERHAGATDASCYLNAGVYLLDPRVVSAPALQPPFSLEHDVFPALVRERPCVGFVAERPVLDIGTPERLRSADRQLR